MRIKQICHPVWEYFNQSVCDAQSNSIWRPQRFWYFYKIKLLEKCWQKDSAWQSPNHK